jgi:peptidyl-tRNA hydrolase
MDKKLQSQLDGLIEKYSELLIGSSEPEHVEMVKAYVLYSSIAKSMPPLAKHWNESYPDAKEAMKELIGEMKKLNETHRDANK